MIETARNMSRKTDGSGKISTTRMVIMPIASASSPRLKTSITAPRPGIPKPLDFAGAPACPAVTSVICTRPQARCAKGALPLLGNYCRVYGYQLVNKVSFMQIGIVGLGRMGANIARRLMQHGHECVVFDANLAASLKLGQEGAK